MTIKDAFERERNRINPFNLKFVLGLTDLVGMILLMTVTSLVLFVTANEQSLWLDEVATVSYADPRLGFAYEDAQMPLIYVLIFVSRVLFGSYEMAYRLPVVILAFGLIQLLPWILKREGVDSVTAWIAPYLLLFMPQFIYYSQEVRAWMPMAVCMIVWGVFRHEGGVKGWLLCSLALQVNTFSTIYVAAVISIDWGYALLKRLEKPVKAPLIALITHIPSILWMLHRLDFFQFRSEAKRAFNIEDILGCIIEVKKTVGYILGSFNYFFDGPAVVWTILILFSFFCLFWKSSPFKRFWIGIAIGIILNAKFFEVAKPILGYTTFIHKAPRYLILLLPMFCILPFLYDWKRKLLSVGVAIIIILSAHLTPVINIDEAVAKMDRSYKSKPWPGIVPQLFARTSNALLNSRRSDWKHLTLLLNALVKPGDTVLFKNCAACLFFPVIFYDRYYGERYSVEKTENKNDCAEWLVSTSPLAAMHRCGFFLISRLDRFFVYGKKEIILQRPILYSRHFELN